MSCCIKKIQPSDNLMWDRYVDTHPKATLYHSSIWQNVIEKTYRHKSYYLIALESSKLKAQSSNKDSITNGQLSASGNIVGILPLIHLKHFIFGDNLISIPFFDLGGILADDEDTEKALLSHAIKIAQKLKVNTIELRHIEPLTWIDGSSKLKVDSIKSGQSCKFCLKISAVTKSHKVRMLLNLPDSSEALMKSFKSKLRSQIKKPLKEGLYAKVGGLELLDDFYKVFLINMRDLGSPVHSKGLMKNLLEEFPEKSKIVMVYKDDNSMACSLIIGFKETLENPWASALREYSRLSPNMLLYWTMLEYACDHGFQYFDFGRSSPDEGTYKFKEQWGAKPTPLHWHYISLDGQPISKEISEKSKFDKAIQFWQKLPVPLTKILGPMIRKHIGL